MRSRRREQVLTSGDPGVRPPDPDALPRPALWSPPAPGSQARAFSGLEEDSATPVSREGWRSAWLAVGLMLVGAVLLGIAFVTRAPVVAVLAVLVGGAGAVLAWKFKIMEDVSVEDSPTGSG